MTAHLPWDVWHTAQARTVTVPETPIHSSAHCILTVLTLSSRRDLAGRSLWPFGQWASDGLGSRQGCQLGRKLAQEGLDEVMGATLVADGRSRGVRAGQVLPLDRHCGPSATLQGPQSSFRSHCAVAGRWGLLHGRSLKAPGALRPPRFSTAHWAGALQGATLLAAPPGHAIPL